jgi:Flp pilus assembly CpaE family ATPase
MTFLREFDLDARVSVILNRVSKKPLFTVKQVAELVGAPVVRSFPNDYQGVARALTSGTLVEVDSELGKSYAEFAETLLTDEPAAVGPKTDPRRKFLEFLAVPANGARIGVPEG